MRHILSRMEEGEGEGEKGNLSRFAEAADGFVNPIVERRETCVDTRQVSAATSDTKADDAHLVPLTVFNAHQRSTSIAL